mgnify:FL=1
MAGNDGSFFTELKRRNVYRVGIAYAIVSWLVLQIIDVVEPIIGIPEWVPKLILVLLAIGLPLALIFAWAYEMTPEGLKRENEVDRTKSITNETGQRLNRIIIGVLAVAVVILLADRYFLGAESPQSPTPQVVAAADEAAAATTEVTQTKAPSIAVLPFMNMSADESSVYFSDGLADTLLHMLAQIREIRVAARTSSFQFRDQNTDITKIAESLNVATILEGSVQRAGNKIRVTAQLIEADTGYHLWSANFDRDLDDIFAIQDEIASEVVAALKISLLGESAEKLTEHGTESVTAYTEYLLGIADINEYTFDSLRRAEQRLLNALDADPDYALALARLGELYVTTAWFGAGDAREMYQKARASASRALDLDPDSPLAISVLADVERRSGNLELAEQLYLRAIELGPNEPSPREGLAAIRMRQNDREAVQALLLEALALDPLSINVHNLLASNYTILGDYDKARQHLAKLREIEPGSPVSWYREADLLFELGDWAEAVSSYMRAHELDPDDPELAVDIGEKLLALGMPDEARKWFDRAAEIDPAHPVARSAPLTLYIYEDNGSREGRALALQLLEERVPARRNTVILILQTLFDDAVRNDSWDATLDLVRDRFPDYFDPDGDWGDQDFGTTWYVGAMLMAAGREEHGMRLLQPLLDISTESTRKYRLGMFHVWNLAATGQRDKLLSALREIKELRRAPESWPTSVVRLHAFDFVRDEPEFIAYVEWLESHSAEQRAIFEASRGVDNKKRGPI